MEINWPLRLLLIQLVSFNFGHFHSSIPLCSAAQEVHNLPFFPLQYTFSSQGLSKHSGCTTNSEASQHVKPLSELAPGLLVIQIPIQAVCFGLNFEHFISSTPLCSVAQEVHNVPFFPLQYTFSSRGLSKHSGCPTNSKAGQHMKRESKSRSYCKGSASFLSLSMYHKPQWLEGE